MELPLHRTMGVDIAVGPPNGFRGCNSEDKHHSANLFGSI